MNWIDWTSWATVVLCTGVVIALPCLWVILIDWLRKKRKRKSEYWDRVEAEADKRTQALEEGLVYIPLKIDRPSK